MKVPETNQKKYQQLRTAMDAVDVILQQITQLDRANSEKELDDCLPGLLASMGQYTLSDRSYIFDWVSDTHDAFHMTHEWCAPGVRPTIGEMQNVEICRMPNWAARFQKKEAIVSMDWEADRDRMPDEYALFDGQDIHALIVLPIFSNQKVSGYIGLDNPDQETSALSLRLLTSVGAHLGSLRENLHMVSVLEQKQRSLQESLAEANLNNEIINSISKIYWLIYRMDLISNTYEEISAGQEVHRLTGKRGRITEVFREVRETVVVPEHQQMMKEFLDITTLPERLEDTESIGVEYHATDGSWHLGRFIVKKRNAQGRVTHVLYLAREINKQKQKELEYQQRLMEVVEDAQRANMAKTDFLRRMSHDIRTPINGIRGMVSIANHYPDDQKRQQECRDKVMEASGFLLDLVNSVLDMNKLESGKIVLEKKSFDLPLLLRETCHIIEMQGQEYNIPLHIETFEIEHPHLIGSPLHLRQILQNIASNAVKYNRKGGSITVACREIHSDGQIAEFRMTCIDTGRGMSESFIGHAFEPFAQEGYGARTAYMGTGLGLSIAKQLVDLMGGSITLESTLNVGTAFTVVLPFEIDHEYQENARELAELPEVSLEGVRVLLTEDNDLNLEIAQFVLEKSGMDVTVAKNGQEAVDLFAASAENYFDVILMDVMMPVLDGLDATRAIRALDRADAQSVPVFAMTANAFDEDIRLSLEAGMNEHLSKPLDERRMLRLIQRYVTPER